MEITYTVNGKTLTINLIGELDEHASLMCKKGIDKLLADNTFNSVVFDLTRLSFMDSTGIGVLIGRYKQLKARSCPIYVKNPNSTIDKIFNMSGLYEIMPKIS